MYPQSALEALNYLRSQPDNEFIEFMLERECYGAVPYLSGKTSDGQWIILWDPENA